MISHATTNFVKSFQKTPPTTKKTTVAVCLVERAVHFDTMEIHVTSNLPSGAIDITQRRSQQVEKGARCTIKEMFVFGYVEIAGCRFCCGKGNGNFKRER